MFLLNTCQFLNNPEDEKKCLTRNDELHSLVSPVLFPAPGDETRFYFYRFESTSFTQNLSLELFLPTRTALWTRHLHVCFKNITHLTVKSRINCYLSFLYLQSSFSTNSYYFPFALLIRYKHFNYNTLHYNICIFKPRVNTYPLKNPPLSNHTLYTLSNLYKQ